MEICPIGTLEDPGEPGICAYKCPVGKRFVTLSKCFNQCDSSDVLESFTTVPNTRGDSFCQAACVLQGNIISNALSYKNEAFIDNSNGYCTNSCREGLY